jgi:hypothetical protein
MVVSESTKKSSLGFREALLAAVVRGERDKVVELLNGFGERTASAVAVSDLDQIAELRAQAVRLRRRVGRLEVEAILAAFVAGQLQAFDIVLDRGRTAALLRSASEERRQLTSVLRDRTCGQAGSSENAVPAGFNRLWSFGGCRDHPDRINSSAVTPRVEPPSRDRPSGRGVWVARPLQRRSRGDRETYGGDKRSCRPADDCEAHAFEAEVVRLQAGEAPRA